MSQQVKWVKRPMIRPDDSGAAATLSRSPVSWAAASRVIREREVSTRELPIIEVTPDDTGELDLDDALAVEVLPGAGPKVSVSATCELQADDVLDVLPLVDRLPMWVEPPAVEPQAPASVAPPPWVIDNFDDLPEASVALAPQRRRQVALWIAAATSAASLGVILAAAAVQMEGSAALVLPRSAHHVAAVRSAAERLHAHASRIPVVSLASLRR